MQQEPGTTRIVTALGPPTKTKKVPEDIQHLRVLAEKVRAGSSLDQKANKTAK